MCEFHLLLIEDDDGDEQRCSNAVNDFNEEDGHNELHFKLLRKNTLEEARKHLDKSIDGAIIDLKLKDGNGNDITKQINDSFLRIPIILITGTPNDALSEFNYVHVFQKGDGEVYRDALLEFEKIYRTGLTRIMGGRGTLEVKLQEVFQKSLLPKEKLGRWITYGESDSEKTEKALLRHILEHLLLLLDDDDSKRFPEEVYLVSSIDNKLRPGSIVKKKNTATYFVVLNPACDLANNTAEKYLLIEIEELDTICKKKGQKEEVRAKKRHYCHWLPPLTGLFPESVLNFKKLSAITPDEYKNFYESAPIGQISPPFVKDIIARFSAYYGRQGQPDIDTDVLKETAE